MASLKERVPWWFKLGAKLVLARVPLGYGLWTKLGIFKHGKMDDEGYAASRFEDRLAPVQDRMPPGFKVLEMGPGDSLATAVTAKAHGASGSYLVDVESHARDDMGFYRSLAQNLAAKGLVQVPLQDVRNVPEMLSLCGSRYLTRGLKDLRLVPDAEVGLIFSTSVLEHVFLDEFEEVQRELRRILKPGGACVHWVDLKDHLGYSLNNLRFKERTWESPLFRHSGFYTNRLRRRQMLALFEKAGFKVESCQETRWEKLPIPQEKLEEPYRSMPEEELTVKGFEVVLT